MRHPTPPYGRESIEALIPHRPPILMLDAVLEASPEEVVALTTLGGDELFLPGHFPGRPVMPGVLLLEAMAQASLILYSYNYDLNDVFFLVKEKSRFLRVVRPVAELRIVVRKIKILPSMGLTSGAIFVAGQKVAESEMGFASERAASLVDSL
jgi:3-hydroxyacyl-[acyl-carrier-protein] dehydratase